MRNFYEMENFSGYKSEKSIRVKKCSECINYFGVKYISSEIVRYDSSDPDNLEKSLVYKVWKMLSISAGVMDFTRASSTMEPQKPSPKPLAVVLNSVSK